MTFVTLKSCSPTAAVTTRMKRRPSCCSMVTASPLKRNVAPSKGARITSPSAPPLAGRVMWRIGERSHVPWMSAWQEAHAADPA
jgi:hypothetical protein